MGIHVILGQSELSFLKIKYIFSQSQFQWQCMGSGGGVCEWRGRHNWFPTTWLWAHLSYAWEIIALPGQGGCGNMTNGGLRSWDKKRKTKFVNIASFLSKLHHFWGTRCEAQYLIFKYLGLTLVFLELLMKSKKSDAVSMLSMESYISKM